jgi:hypothetical protein
MIACDRMKSQTFNQEVMGSNPIALTNEIKGLRDTPVCQLDSFENRLDASCSPFGSGLSPERIENLDDCSHLFRGRLIGMVDCHV